MSKEGLLIVCFTLLCILFEQAWGASWKFVGFNRYRDAFYIDEDRVERVTNESVQLWVKLTIGKKSLFRQVMKQDFERIPKRIEEVKYIEMKEEINCKEQKIKHIELIYYDHKNKPMLKIVSPEARWKPAIAGSLWHEVVNLSCEKIKRSQE
ncbi:MAG: hypothetical protein N2572_08455 [Syntrophales bacterium]|nr:hypothetical protein [Syntrophales bacterium]